MRRVVVRTVLGLLAIMALSPCLLEAGGEPGVRAGELRKQVRHVLDREGYIGRYSHGQELQRGISAYLWDHRSWLKRSDFHNSRQMEAMVCLLVKRGYAGFERYAGNQSSMENCRRLVK